jgi:hypothetical protein
VENIDQFNGHAAKAFAKLYSNFPEPTVLDCREIVYDKPFGSQVHVDELQHATTDPKIRACAAALNWLHKTGYFEGHPDLHTVIVQRAVLTPKGFEAMAATPAALKAGEPVGMQLSRLAKDAGKEGTKKQIADLIGWAIGAAIGVA